MTRWRWRLYLAIALLGPTVCVAAGFGYLYLSSARLIEQRMRDASERTPARVFARPMQLRHGQTMGHQELVERLNELGYARRERVDAPGQFAVGQLTVALQPREGEVAGRTLTVGFAAATADVPDGPEQIDRLAIGDRMLDRVALDRPLISGLATPGRQKQRKVALAQVPRSVVEAVLAIEDRRFYLHPGVDAIRTVGAIVTNGAGNRPYLVGGSTLTQQLVKNFFLSPEKTIRRKLLEQTMALILEQRLSKDEILELYLNEVYLGQRGSFAIHGVAEAAHLFFGRSIANVTLAEAATIAGVIQSPASHSPFTSPDRSRQRRNVVLQAMSRAGFISEDTALRVSREPFHVASRALEAEAPYFVDLIGEGIERQYPGLHRSSERVSVFTTLDLQLQRVAQRAVAEGLASIDEQRGDRAAEVALIALDPRTGQIRALVGGRSYRHSQFNRATRARRQPGSVFKPFVFLTAFERAAADGRRDLTPATLVNDVPTTFMHGRRAWRPSNYRDVYGGLISWRRALALSRNVAAVKVAQLAGFGQVADLWTRIGAGAQPEPYPSIALGVFEATPMEIAAAYTVFPNGGVRRPLTTIEAIQHGDVELAPVPVASPTQIAGPETTFLVTDMMRSVMAGGTGSRARALGFRRDAAGKSGTTNGLRDAWFVGFTPELLTVVWVGRDDNAPLGLNGTQAALPIWTRFMATALSGEPDSRFSPPPGVHLVTIDPDTGQLAGPYCPRTQREAFFTGSEPVRRCDRHLL